ncbi:MAG: response regulator transcription factor [Chloroflexales bacterium]|nr:response regulator transcription factor [Chloroflexales bacterium]
MNTGRAPVRVLVVDDQRIICEGIASLLSLHDDIAVLGMASNGQEALERALALRPDVVLMDVRMPVMDGPTATAAIRRQLPTCQVLVLTTFDDDEAVVAAMQAGACGYLLKDIPPDDLAHAIHAAHRRMYLFDRSLVDKVVAALLSAEGQRHDHTPAPRAPLAGPQASLSNREIEVLRLIARGASNREIAMALVISEGTVKAHISSILSRLGLRDRTQAALAARDYGWL